MSIGQPDHDPVNSPSHYASDSGIECIDAMRAAFHPSEVAAFCKLNSFKYIWRAGKKGSYVEDLEKAQVYLGWAIDASQLDEPMPEEGEAGPPECDDYHCYCPTPGICCVKDTPVGVMVTLTPEAQAIRDTAPHIAGSGTPGDPFRLEWPWCKSESCPKEHRTDTACDSADPREKARKEFEAGMERASDRLAGVTVVSFPGPGFAVDLDEADVASVGSPHEAPTDSPHPAPDHRGTSADALAVALGRLVRSGVRLSRVQ